MPNNRPRFRTPLKTREPLRFAHPFFTTTPIERRAPQPETGMRRMDQFLQDNLERVPVPHKGGLWSLRDVIGADGANAIAQAGRIRLHATGDTGLPKQDMQEPIAEAMATDFQPDDLVGSPAYFLHLGDVIYFNNTDPGYLEQFYQPYTHYPGH